MDNSTRQEIFVIGCKLLGVYCFVNAIPTIFQVVTMFIVFGDYPPNLSTSATIVKIIAVLTPVIYGVAGFYLLISGGKLYEKVYSIDTFDKVVIEKFRLFLKMLGMFFLITYTSQFLSILSDFLFHHFAPKYMDMFTQVQNVYTNFLPILFGMGIGLYLLLSGKIFIRIGFKNKQKNSEYHKDLS